MKQTKYTKEKMTTKDKAPKLAELAEACNNGACNPMGLITAFGTAVRELTPGEVSTHPAVRNILGHLSFLCGQALGPETSVIVECEKWLRGDT